MSGSTENQMILDNRVSVQSMMIAPQGPHISAQGRAQRRPGYRNVKRSRSPEGAEQFSDIRNSFVSPFQGFPLRGLPKPRALPWADMLSPVGAAFILIAMYLVLASTTHAAAPEGDEAVESGKQALNQFWDYPWYDAQADKARPIEVQPPPPPSPPRNTNWDWSWLSDFLVYMGWTILALVIVLVVFLMLRAEWSRAAALIEGEEQPGETGPIQPDRVEELPFKLVQPNKDFFSTAEEYYREGDYSTAILYLYSYLLLELDRAQVIHLTRGKTNRQYLRETRRHSAAGPVLEPTMVAFEEVFFGHHPLSRDRFEACWSEVPRFKALLTQVPAQKELVAV